MRIRPKTSGGFTLTEIMIVVAIIGLLTTLIAPRALRAREQACVNAIRNNLRIIEDSKCLWATEKRARQGDLPQTDQLLAYFKGERLPNPVAGETYNINPVGRIATATLSQNLVDFSVGSELSIE